MTNLAAGDYRVPLRAKARRKWSLKILLFEVKPVKYSMKHGRQQNTCGRDENNTGEKSIAGGKYLGGVRVQGLHGSHTRENHGGIQERVDPTEASDKMVTENAKKEREPEHSTGKKKCAQDAMIESSSGVRLIGAW